MPVTEEQLDIAVNRRVERFNPQCIILFGSQARGTADERSDVDILVVTNFKGARRPLIVEMDMALKGVGFARDIIVKAPQIMRCIIWGPLLHPRNSSLIKISLEQSHGPRSSKERCCMSGIEESIEKKVVHWFSLADENLVLANHAFSVKAVPPYRLITFHAQQCVEKYLKAYLVFHRIDFPYTHNIARLLEICPNKTTWDNEIEEAGWLSQYAVSTRYSDESEPVTEIEARNAVEIAEKVGSPRVRAHVG